MPTLAQADTPTASTLEISSGSRNDRDRHQRLRALFLACCVHLQLLPAISGTSINTAVDELCLRDLRSRGNLQRGVVCGQG